MAFLLHTNPLAQFYTLVTEAQQQAHCSLQLDLESYLVFLLMRYVQKPEISSQLLGLKFLEARINPLAYSEHLRDVGDGCLLLAGLFPDQAEKRRVSDTYWIELGQSAFSHLATYTPPAESQLYHTLCQEFVPLTCVLKATRMASSSN